VYATGDSATMTIETAVSMVINRVILFSSLVTRLQVGALWGEEKVLAPQFGARGKRFGE